MKNHEEERRQLKRWTLLNFFIIATIILVSGFLIGEQTLQPMLVGKFVAFLLAAGFVCTPFVYQLSQLRLEKSKNYQVKIVDTDKMERPENVDNQYSLNNTQLPGTAIS